MKRTILLADDSPTIQRLVTQTFADSDFSVVSVSNGDAAIRKLEEIQADIVLADVYMPGRNGYEVCAHVRSRAGLGSVPVILLAGAFDAYDEQTAATAGATAHIRKPFEPRALVSLVMEVSKRGDSVDVKNASSFSEPAAIDAASPGPSIALAAPSAAADLSREPDAAQARPAAGASVPAPEISHSSADARAADIEDVLGLEQLFKPASQTSGSAPLSDEEIERIAERVVRRITKEAIESVAWDVVPDIAAQVLRDELNNRKR